MAGQEIINSLGSKSNIIASKHNQLYLLAHLIISKKNVAWSWNLILFPIKTVNKEIWKKNFKDRARPFLKFSNIINGQNLKSFRFDDPTITKSYY